MKSKTVAILETRTGEHLGELIERRGGVALLAPALEEVPDVDPSALAGWLQSWRAVPFRMAIFQTGVGTRALFQTLDALGATAPMLEWLAAAVVVVRGPKPVGELSARQIRIDIRAPSPFTTETVVKAVDDIALDGVPVLVQRYGAANPQLRDALQTRGALVQEIATYRWALPSDVRPLEVLLDALSARRVDAVVFTSAVQIHNLQAVAEGLGRAPSLAAGLQGPVIASIGPVCSRALRQYGIEPTFEASPPKLGPLVDGLDRALSAKT